MDPLTTAIIAVSTSVLVKISDKASDRFSDAVIDRTGDFLKRLRQKSPQTVNAIELANEKRLDYGQAVLEVEAAAKTDAEFDQAVRELGTAASADPELRETINAANKESWNVANRSKLAEKINNLYQAPVTIEKQENNF
ncbi:hypothetical protein [Oscillatoria sp. FACHB-1406]|uniref:hypothetical protein n=1 Tax=Oscillatoria sp. FACHB-1406 TaxID=2692846 RepID=UPI0016844B21|nr:hypothetical protein [Oscillatoria sp. FACHB-1406]MBD2577486.1 hypothetical protein [Oscillatoria sp. FACHB-1406]